MAAPKGTRPPGGSRKGVPNKLTADVRAMILGALSDAGGQQYLVRMAEAQPVAFMALLGKVLPLQVAGEPTEPLVVRVVHYGEAKDERDGEVLPPPGKASAQSSCRRQGPRPI